MITLVDSVGSALFDNYQCNYVAFLSFGGWLVAEHSMILLERILEQFMTYKPLVAVDQSLVIIKFDSYPIITGFVNSDQLNKINFHKII